MTPWHFTGSILFQFVELIPIEMTTNCPLCARFARTLSCAFYFISFINSVQDGLRSSRLEESYNWSWYNHRINQTFSAIYADRDRRDLSVLASAEIQYICVKECDFLPTPFLSCCNGYPDTYKVTIKCGIRYIVICARSGSNVNYNY